MRFLSSLVLAVRPSSTFQKIMNQKVLYFAYGSNLSSERIRIQNKSAVFKAVGLLRGYQLRFCFKSQRWGGAAANIMPGPPETSHVLGVVWELEEYDLANLDIQEGVAAEIYERMRVTVDVNGSSYDCLAYQLTEKTRTKSIAEEGEDQRPSKMYKSVIVKGAKEHGLPQEYIDSLEYIQDNGEEGTNPVN